METKAAKNRTTAVSIALDQCVASSVTGPGDLLYTANMVSLRANQSLRRTLPHFEWSVAGNGPVVSSSGVNINPTKSLKAIESADVVFVSAIGAYSEKALLEIVANASEIQMPLRIAYENGAYIVGLCTGTLILAEAGLLKDRETTTSWWFSPKFAARYSDADVNPDSMVTIDERIICAGAGAANFDATLTLINAIGGPWLSEMVASYFVLDRNRASQSAYMIPAHLIASDPKVKRADRIIRENISNKLSVESLAKELGLSERSLHRRLVAATGLTPRAYIGSIRMELAKNLILQGEINIDAVAERVGYLDTNSFRRAFKAEVGMTVGAFASLQV